MPRGYSYDHFQVPKREPRERATPSDSLKAATSHKGDSQPLAESQEGLHYGRKNAETLTRLKARGQKKKEAESEAPARPTRAQAKRAAPASRTSAKAKAPARGGKLLSRVAAAAKTSVKRVAKKAVTKVTARKSSKKQS